MFHLFSLFLNKSEKEELADRFMTPGMRYGDIKNELFECFWSYFEPFREKRIYLENHKDFVFESLKKDKPNMFNSEIVKNVYVSPTMGPSLKVSFKDI